MSGETTNGGAHAGIKEEDANNRPPPPTAADDGKHGEGDNDRKESTADDLLSHVVPPSHILSDGRFIQLPPPSSSDRSAFFERAVASHRLITDADGERRGGSVSGKRQADDETASETASRDGKRRKKATTDAPFVHPLAIASARLRAKGIDELSKAINLGGLVLGGEYFGLTNVISNQSDAAAAGRGGNGRGKDHSGGNANDASSGGGDAATTTEESIIIDQRLRSKYVLQRRRVQYENASTVLSRHSRRLSSSVSVRRILDERMRTLRRRWRLVAPEHGTRTVGVVRPREVVAVDVEVYDRDRLSSVGGAKGDTSSSLGRIARRVPRFATMELDDDYDVSSDIQRLRKQIKHVLEGLKRMDDDDDEGNASADNMEVEHRELKEEQ